MKKRKWIWVLLIVGILVLTRCRYDPPEGWKTWHHSYRAALEYAQSIDPEAIVSKGYVDLKDEYGYVYRQWDAVIHGTACHVASCQRLVYNTGFMGGEFGKKFHAMDTDYDYLLLKTIAAEKQPQWQLWKDDASARYQKRDMLIVYIPASEERELTDAELDLIWKKAKALVEEYASYTVHKTVYFSLPAPVNFYNSQSRSYVVKMDRISFHDFTEAGKEEFFTRYKKYWQMADEIQS